MLVLGVVVVGREQLESHLSARDRVSGEQTFVASCVRRGTKTSQVSVKEAISSDMDHLPGRFIDHNLDRPVTGVDVTGRRVCQELTRLVAGKFWPPPSASSI